MILPITPNIIARMSVSAGQTEILCNRVLKEGRSSMLSAASFLEIRMFSMSKNNDQG